MEAIFTFSSPSFSVIWLPQSLLDFFALILYQPTLVLVKPLHPPHTYIDLHTYTRAYT